MLSLLRNRYKNLAKMCFCCFHTAARYGKKDWLFWHTLQCDAWLDHHHFHWTNHSNHYNWHLLRSVINKLTVIIMFLQATAAVQYFIIMLFCVSHVWLQPLQFEYCTQDFSGLCSLGFTKHPVLKRRRFKSLHCWMSWRRLVSHICCINIRALCSQMHARKPLP